MAELVVPLPALTDNFDAYSGKARLEDEQIIDAETATA